MNRRHKIYLAVIGVLIIANIARWGLQQGTAESSARGQSVLPEDLRMRVDIPGAAGAPARDLFRPSGGGGRSTGKGAPARLVHVKTPPPKPVAPQPTPAIQAPPETGLGQLRLLGVVFHGGKKQAYLAQGKEASIVATGETVFGQYAVETIAVDAVELRDIRNNATRRIPVSGK